MKPLPQITVAQADGLSIGLHAEIRDLCARAYGEQIDHLLATFVNPTHVLASLEGALVSHALWVTRWLQQAERLPLRSAYVEMVATDPTYQKRGLATAVMSRLANEIAQYDLGALCPARPDVYSRLGWDF